MPLPASGLLAFSNIITEFSITANSTSNLSTHLAPLIGQPGPIKRVRVSDFYSASNVFGNTFAYAGTGVRGTVDGARIPTSQFSYPISILADAPSGVLYIMGQYENRMRRIDLSTGLVSTLATGVPWAHQLTRDNFSNLYIASRDEHTIRRFDLVTNTSNIFAGGAGLTGYTDATGTSARFNFPSGIVYHNSNLFVADSDNHRIRRITVPGAVVTTFAGSGTDTTSNGLGTAASFSRPLNLAVDSSSVTANLYVQEERGRCIRRIYLPTANVLTFAGLPAVNGGGGYVDATGVAARFNYMNGLFYASSNLYVGDTNNNMIRRVTVPGAVVSTLAGQTTGGYLEGVGTAAKFNIPFGVTFYSGYVFVADGFNFRIRKIRAR
jgi:hypothetical protein